MAFFLAFFLQVSTVFTPGNFQGFALVNRQRTNRIDSGFSIELSTDGTQLSYTNFNYLGQEPHYWQLPNAFQGDKVEFGSVIYFIVLTSLRFCLLTFYLEVASPTLNFLQINLFLQMRAAKTFSSKMYLVRSVLLQLRNVFIVVGVYTKAIVGSSINKLSLLRLNLTVSLYLDFVSLFWMWYTDLSVSVSTCHFRSLTLLGLDEHTR